MNEIEKMTDLQSLKGSLKGRREAQQNNDSYIFRCNNLSDDWLFGEGIKVNEDQLRKFMQREKNQLQIIKKKHGTGHNTARDYDSTSSAEEQTEKNFHSCKVRTF